jgi:hypothetical protein
MKATRRVLLNAGITLMVMCTLATTSSANTRRVKAAAPTITATEAPPVLTPVYVFTDFNRANEMLAAEGPPRFRPGRQAPLPSKQTNDPPATVARAAPHEQQRFFLKHHQIVPL